MNDSNTPRIRWRGAAVIAVLAAIALMLIWRRDISQQDRILKTGILLVAAALALFFWVLFFAGFKKRVRLWTLAGGLTLIAFLFSSMRITGVSGDLIPIFRFRWSKPREIGGAAATNSKAIQRAASASFPQFLGPTRNGLIPGVALETNWVTHPPQELWRREVGPAWTGFVISDGLAITQEQRGENEFVTAYALATGAPVWSHSDNSRYFNTLGGEGPRSNPTIDGGRVYTFGSMGILNCLDLATGELRWTKNIPGEHSGGVPEWGFAGAPLVHNGLVIINASAGQAHRTLVAYDTLTGKFAWGAGDDSAGYSSPTLLTIGGVPQIVLFTQRHVTGQNPENGALLWSHPWPPSHPHVAMPIQISANQILASSGYGTGSELIEITHATNNTWGAERVWKSNRLKSKFANLILHEHFVYGLDDGILTCLDPATGERKWHGERHGHGQLLLIGNILLLMAENGEILLVDPSPNEERIIARFKALKGKTWNPPAFAAPYLLVRNDAEAACFKLPAK